jgi:hypothetical protein
MRTPKRKGKKVVDYDMVEPSIQVVIDEKRKTKLLSEELRNFLVAAKSYGELEGEEEDFMEDEKVGADEGR